MSVSPAEDDWRLAIGCRHPAWLRAGLSEPLALEADQGEADLAAGAGGTVYAGMASR